MRFLVDTQLPHAVARWLAERGHTAEHIYDIGLHTAADRVLWDYVVFFEAVIITKDEDFALRRTLVEAGPAIVWLRRGNTNRRDLPACSNRCCPPSSTC
jgi:predicted nuclease of predicted toxin-antitoxin system